MIKNTPGITITENIILQEPEIPNNYIPTVAFLPSAKGPSMVNTRIYDQEHFIEVFGLPDDYNYKFWYNIYEYLSYVKGINIMRVIDDTWKNNITRYTGSTSKASTSRANLYNDNIAFGTLSNPDYYLGNTTTIFEIINREISNEEDIAVSICNSSTFSSLISDEMIGHRILTRINSIPTPDLVSTFGQKIWGREGGFTKMFTLSSTYTKEIKIQSINTEFISGFDRTVIQTLTADLTIPTNLKELYIRDYPNPSKNGQYLILSVTAGATYTDIVLTTDLQEYSYNSSLGKIWIDVVQPALPLYYEAYYLSVVQYYYIEDEKKFFIGSTTVSTNLDFDVLFSNENIYRKTMDSSTQNLYTGEVKTYEQVINKAIDWTIVDNIIFVFKKKDGLFTLVESFAVSLSTTTSAKRNIFCEKMINDNSRYIYIKKNTNYVGTSSVYSNNNLSLTDCKIANHNTYNLTALNDYDSYKDATDWYRVGNNIKFSYILGLELKNSTTNYMNMNLASDIAMSKERQDCIAINALWDETRYNSYTGLDLYNKIALDFGTSSSDNLTYYDKLSTYTDAYANMKYIYDEFNGKYRWIPVIGDVAGIYAYEDLNNSEFSAPAGVNVTKIKNAVKMLVVNGDKTYLDLLAYNSINAIIQDEITKKYMLFDILMSEKEDLMTKRLNIRRTVNFIKRKTHEIMKGYFFNYNTPEARTEIVRKLNDMLNKVAEKNGINSNYYVRCDDSNNYPDTVNDEELYVELHIQPTRVIRNILIQVNLYKNIININEKEI